MARVRFAPSPTGMLHLGGARTALFNYLYAKSSGGSFIVRIEDTDKEREVLGSVDSLQRSLEWLGLHSDEGPSIGGKFGPYIQSERLSLYRQYAAELLKTGHAYHCFCSQKRLKSLSFRDGKLGYDGYCRKLSRRTVEEKLQMGSPYTVRLKVPESGSTTVSDVVYGQVNIVNSETNDQILLKSDGRPTYHLASVVDDHLMEISHVLRGEEWLLSTAKHLMIYSAFGWIPPIYAHLPLLVSSSGAKLSKRNNDQFIDSYKEEGFHPEAVVNFIGLLGWGPSVNVGADECTDKDTHQKEILDLNKLVESFSLEGINRNPAAVNNTKLLWMNKHYHNKKLIRENSLNEMALQLQAGVSRSYNIPVGDDAINLDHLKKILLLLEDRIPFVPKIISDASYFWVAPTEIKFEISTVKDKGDYHDLVPAKLLKVVKRSLEFRNFDQDTLNTAIKESAEQLGLPLKQVMLLIRLAFTGTKATPGLSAVMELIGKKEVMKRLEDAINVTGTIDCGQNS